MCQAIPTITVSSLKDHVNDYSSFAPLELLILLNHVTLVTCGYSNPYV